MQLKKISIKDHIEISIVKAVTFYSIRCKTVSTVCNFAPLLLMDMKIQIPPLMLMFCLLASIFLIYKKEGGIDKNKSNIHEKNKVYAIVL
jgi:hypothetical protein